MHKKTRYIILIAIIAVFGGLIAWYKLTPGKYDQLATCLTEKKVVFYGAFWCPHCQATKKAFGKSAKLLPYVECSTPDGSAQQQVCTDAGIKSYPTWIFPDGSQLSGEQSMEVLATKATCPLP